jgi:hypothetical protein
MKTIIQNLNSSKDRDIIKQGIYKNVKYEIHKEGMETVMWYIEFNEEYIKYKTPVDFQHLEKDFEPQYAESLFMLNKHGEQEWSIEKKSIPCLRDCNAYNNMHLMALNDLLYVEIKDHIFTDMYKPIDQVLQEIKNSIDGIIEYQKTALKLVEYENKMEYVYNEFHKSISKQEEKHKKDIQALDKEYEVYLK